MLIGSGVISKLFKTKMFNNLDDQLKERKESNNAEQQNVMEMQNVGSEPKENGEVELEK
jgi:hypothetical protein